MPGVNASCIKKEGLTCECDSRHIVKHEAAVNIVGEHKHKHHG